MSGIETAYVHIGLHKTGTTSIQRAFARQRRGLLENHGLIYPSVAANHSGPLHSMFCREPESYSWNLVHGTSGKEAVAMQNATYAAAFARDLALPGHSIVFCGEDLCRLGRRAVDHFKHWLEPSVNQIRVLAYAREPVAWATSHVQQQVRKGRTLEELLALNLAPRFRKRLEPWLIAFGAEAMVVHDFDSARCHPSGLVAQFAEQVGLTAEAYRSMVSMHANQSFSAEAVALMSVFNQMRRRLDDNRSATERSQAVERAFGRVKGPKFTLPPDAAKRIQEAAEGDAAWLSDTFGVRFGAPALPATEPKLFGSPEGLESLASLISELASASR